MEKQFYLYKRDRVYYVAFSSELCNGQRMRMSTRCLAKTDALLWVADKLKTLKDCPSSTLGDRFAQLSADWWIDGKCPHQKECRRDGKELALSYMATARRLLVSELMPRFGSRRIQDITTSMIDDWKYDMHERQGLSCKSCNTYMTYLRTMFDYWWRHGYIRENPSAKVRWMRKEQTQRGILTEEEAHAVLGNPGYWDNPVAYLASLLAACTGMRVGEVQALQAKDIQPDGTIMVRHSYDEKFGLKRTKTGTVRCIPLPPALYEAISDVKPSSLGYIFNFDMETPMTRYAILRGFRRAMVRAGISLKDQMDRKICFHSWRHYLNSRLRACGLPDVVVKAVTGHSTDQMMEHYTHISALDARGVTAVAEAFVPQNIHLDCTAEHHPIDESGRYVKTGMAKGPESRG